MEPVVIGVVGEVAHQAGVLHAPAAAASLGSRSVTSCAIRVCRQVEGVVAARTSWRVRYVLSAGVLRVRVTAVTIRYVLRLLSVCRCTRQAGSAVQVVGSSGVGNGRFPSETVCRW